MFGAESNGMIEATTEFGDEMASTIASAVVFLKIYFCWILHVLD